MRFSHGCLLKSGMSIGMLGMCLSAQCPERILAIHDQDNAG